MLLGARLLGDGTIDLDQLEAALRAQLRFGGRLGKNLVELGAITLDTLGDALAKDSGHALADGGRFDAADARAITSVPPEVLRRLIAFPLALDDGPPATLTVAMADPDDIVALGTLALASGCTVNALIAPELRIRSAIERHHGRDPGMNDRTPGFVVAASPTTLLPRGATTQTLPPARVMAAAAPTIPPPLRSQSSTSPPPLRPATASPMAPPPLRSVGKTTAPPPLRLTMTDTMARLQAASTRDEIADALIQFTASRAGAALLFLVRDGGAAGWRSGVPTLGDGAFAKLSLQLPLGSMLARAIATRAPVRGRAEPVDAPLFTALTVGATPPDVLVAPLVVGARVVNLLACAGLAGSELDDAAAEAVVAIAAGAETAYSRIIQRAKKR